MGVRFERMEGFQVSGMSVRTSNEKGQSMRDQGNLWQACMQEGIFGAAREVLGVYSGYEGDWTRPFTFTLATRIGRGSPVPEGCEALAVDGGEFAIFEASASNAQEAASAVWREIWGWQEGSLRPRAYRTDFEVWDAASLAGTEVRVKVCISVT